MSQALLYWLKYTSLLTLPSGSLFVTSDIAVFTDMSTVSLVTQLGQTLVDAGPDATDICPLQQLTFYEGSDRSRNAAELMFCFCLSCIFHASEQRGYNSAVSGDLFATSGAYEIPCACGRSNTFLLSQTLLYLHFWAIPFPTSVARTWNSIPSPRNLLYLVLFLFYFFEPLQLHHREGSHYRIAGHLYWHFLFLSSSFPSAKPSPFSRIQCSLLLSFMGSLLPLKSVCQRISEKKA